jgi:hypothetical protein
MGDEASVLPFSEDHVTLGLLLISLGIFVYLAIRANNIRSFQFQISGFIVLMVIAEIVNLEINQGVIQLPRSLMDLGYVIHLGSMVIFCLLLWLRYYFSKKSGTNMIEKIPQEES